MIYYARSENQNGIRETVQHHLQRTSELCSAFTADFGEAALGKWLGALHDFGKYSDIFQEVLDGSRCHVDHAMPGAAFLSAKLCGKKWEASSLWPMVVAIRCHHSVLQNDVGPEIRNWMRGEKRSPDGSEYSIKADEIKTALQAFEAEVGLPKELPRLPVSKYDNDPEVYGIQRMLLIRMIYSALIDADYSASAEHFSQDYLSNSSIPSFNPNQAYQRLCIYREEIAEHSPADPAIIKLRNDLFTICEAAGRTNSGIYTLTAPTGSGKTLAMLAFSLQQMISHGKKRIILILPYLSIIEQNAAVYRKIIPDILEDHSQAERENDFSRELSQRWDAPFIITTSVKFFESMFSCNASACRKLHHLANSIILFDEAQSLPTHLAKITLTAMQELARTYQATIVFSTATQPDFNQLQDFSWHPTEIVPSAQDLFLSAKRVTVKWNLEYSIPLLDIAADMKKEQNVCIIVNLRAHAQKIFDYLSEEMNHEDLYLMSSDLCPAHRTRIIADIKNKLNKGQPCCLIATQCIEAGVDLSFDIMYRALAPLESIIQAAGRCNRSNTQKRGKLTVFIPDEDRLYPDPFYQQSANAVLTLNSRHKIDLDNLEHIQEYYEILYRDGKILEKKKLSQAVKSLDFVNVAQEYRIIEDEELQILIPCPGEEELYLRLAEEARRGGVTPQWMRKAAPLTVHSYQRELVHQTCEQLFTYSGSPRCKQYCNWYILSNPALYDYKKGLRLTNDFNAII